MRDIRQAEPAVETWRNRALCRFPADYKLTAESWYPMPSQSAQAAKDVCLGCPVRYECGRDAIHNHDRHGVRAGFSLPKQAQSLRRYLALVESNRVTEALLEDQPATTEAQARLCGRCGKQFHTTRNRQICWPCGSAAGVPVEVVAAHVDALHDMFGWSYREIARRAGVDNGTISRIARGSLDTVAERTAERVLAVTGADAEAVAS